MEKQIYFKQPQKPRVPISLIPHRWGPNGHIVVASTDHSVWFALSGNIATLAMQLRATAKRLEEMICTKTEKGIIQGETESQPEEFNLITADDLTGDPAHDWSLISARFPWLSDTVPTEYSKANGNGRLQVQPIDQLGLDMEMVKDIAAELIDDDGKPIWGAQSRIAKALGLPSTGGVYRNRILDILEKLRVSICEQATT